MAGGESEQQQFTEYFAARRDAVRRTAFLLCGDWYWADDLTQTAFMRLAVGWQRVRDRGALDAFVRTCLMRAYLAETGRAWRRRERTLAAVPDRPGGSDATDGTASRIAFAAALRQLPARQRAVLVCRYYHDLDVATTAEALGCSQGTVKSHGARGLARLRVLLSEDAQDYPLGLVEGRQ